MAIIENEDNKRNYWELWKKYKNYVYGALLFILGAMGGNVDKIPGIIAEALPDGIFIKAEEFLPRIDTLEEKTEKNKVDIDNLLIRVNNLEGAPTEMSHGRIHIK